MSIGYSADSLQKEKIENLEKEFESQTNLINIKLNKMQSAFGYKLETYNNEFKEQNTDLQVEESQFDNDETQIVVNAKLFLDINKSIEDRIIKLKDLEQDIKNKILEKKNEILLEATNLNKEQQTILFAHFERNIY